jgi:hypothetical protein
LRSPGWFRWILHLFCLTSSVVILASGVASAKLSRLDPNDVSFRPDIRQSSSATFRGHYKGTTAGLARFTVTFYDKIRWPTIVYISVPLDTRGNKDTDVVLTWLETDTGFACRLLNAVGLGAGDQLLSESEMQSYGRTAKSVTCTVPKAGMPIKKRVRWSAIVRRKGGIFPNLHFDDAPNQGVYPHL